LLLRVRLCACAHPRAVCECSVPLLPSASLPICLHILASHAEVPACLAASAEREASLPAAPREPTSTSRLPLPATATCYPLLTCQLRRVSE
jgi:hypothetical protein